METQLKLKKIVEEIHKSVMKMIVAIDKIYGSDMIVQNKSNSDDQENLKDRLDNIYNQWNIEGCVIGSKIHAYYLA